MAVSLVFFLALFVVGEAQEPFGENNFVAGIVIGTICASIVCCVPHVIWCCICRCLCKSRNKRKAIDNTATRLSVVEVGISTGEGSHSETSRNQGSTQVQIIDNEATTDRGHTYLNVAPSVPMLHRQEDGELILHQQTLEAPPSNRLKDNVVRSDIPPIPPPPPSYTMSTNPAYDISVGHSAHATNCSHSQPSTTGINQRCSELYESI